MPFNRANKFLDVSNYLVSVPLLLDSLLPFFLRWALPTLVSLELNADAVIFVRWDENKKVSDSSDNTLCLEDCSCAPASRSAIRYRKT